MNKFGAVISDTIRSRILEKLENNEISSTEVDLLIDEIGEIVASLQAIYSYEMRNLKNLIAQIINDRFELLKKEIMGQLNGKIDLNDNKNIDKLIAYLFMKYFDNVK